jgi:hypothetical protein
MPHKHTHESSEQDFSKSNSTTFERMIHDQWNFP